MATTYTPWTRLHFEATAIILAEQMKRIATGPEYATGDEAQRRLAARAAVMGIAYQFIDLFDAQNPRFDRNKFLRMCGL